MAYALPTLPYAYDALEPHIDAKTMEIHHMKHHQAYIDKVNKALEGTEWERKDVAEVIWNIKKLPPDKQAAVRNNGGGHYNHSIFWTIMAPPSSSGAGGKPSGMLMAAIEASFVSFEKFQEEFEAKATGQFGSGWAWLVSDGKKLTVTSTPNQDSPMMEGKEPLMGVDVWEHAYYLKYQNKRPEYLKAWWNVVNWKEVEKRFERM